MANLNTKQVRKHNDKPDKTEKGRYCLNLNIIPEFFVVSVVSNKVPNGFLIGLLIDQAGWRSVMCSSFSNRGSLHGASQVKHG